MAKNGLILFQFYPIILSLLTTIVLFGCNNFDNSNRIRPIGSSSKTSEQELSPQTALPKFTYNLTKNGAKWIFPALTDMNLTYSIDTYGDTTFTILIDNTFSKNDTLYKDKLEVKFKNIPYNNVGISVGSSLSKAQANYSTGTQYRSFYYYCLNPEYPPYVESTLSATELSKSRKKIAVNLYLVGSSIITINGSIEFEVE